MLRTRMGSRSAQILATFFALAGHSRSRETRAGKVCRARTATTAVQAYEARDARVTQRFLALFRATNFSSNLLHWKHVFAECSSQAEGSREDHSFPVRLDNQGGATSFSRCLLCQHFTTELPFSCESAPQSREPDGSACLARDRDSGCFVEFQWLGKPQTAYWPYFT